MKRTGNVHLDRLEALALLKKLIASNLIEPSWISIESAAEVYKLKIKATQKTVEIEQFFSSNNLVLEEQNGYWLISKP